MSKVETNYRDDAKSDAREMVSYFLDSIVEQLMESGKASEDINNDYPGGDSYHHESHVDRWYSLLEAAELLDQLDDFEESDDGLWDGQSPRDAIATQAAYTYGQAVASMWSDMIGEINGDETIAEILEAYQEIEDPTDEQTKATEGQLAERIRHHNSGE